MRHFGFFPLLALSFFARAQTQESSHQVASTQLLVEYNVSEKNSRREESYYWIEGDVSNGSLRTFSETRRGFIYLGVVPDRIIDSCTLGKAIKLGLFNRNEEFTTSLRQRENITKFEGEFSNRSKLFKSIKSKWEVKGKSSELLEISVALLHGRLLKCRCVDPDSSYEDNQRIIYLLNPDAKYVVSSLTTPLLVPIFSSMYYRY